MNMKMKLWTLVDIETTGLDVNRDVILEIAAVVLDANLKVLGRYHSLVEPSTPLSEIQMNDWVLKTHADSCLFYDLGYGMSPKGKPVLNGVGKVPPHIVDVGEGFCEFLSELADEHLHAEGKMIFVGNSIMSLDIPFIREHMPAFNELPFVHYRTIDLSAINEALSLAKGVEELDFGAAEFLHDKNMAAHKKRIEGMHEGHRDAARAKLKADPSIMVPTIHKHRATTDVMLSFEQFKYTLKVLKGVTL